MNPAQLLTHFDRISEAPDAISRLRHFILDLAVRGKLVEQDPRDEPASELLKWIDAEKALLVKHGEIRKQELLGDLDESDIPFELPSGWLWSRLGNIGDWGSGSTPPRGNIEYYGGETTWLKSGELGDCLALKGSEERVTAIALRKCSFRLNQPGDVLIAMYGATIGKLAILAEPAVTNQAVCGCTPFAGILNRYLFTYLLSRRAEFHAQSEGGAQPNISKVKIVLSPFPLPPLAEQQRIVAKVDELMALCDQLEAAQAERESRRDRLAASSLNRLNNGADPDAFRDHARFYFNHFTRLTTRSEHIQQLRQTILNLAVRGKLVPQDPNDEPAFVLHDRLSLERTKNHQIERARPRRDILPSATGFFGNDVFPPSWVLTNFDRLNAIVSGVAKGKDLRGLKTATYPYLRVANVQRGYLDLAVVKELEICADQFSRYQLRQGDVLMTEGGDWDKLGRAAIWNDEVPNCIHQNHIYRIRSANKEGLLPEWIVLFANSPLGRSYFEGASKQTTNLASINMTQLRSCPLPLPPIAEQQRIVAKVEELMGLCDRLEAQLTTTQTESRRLLEAVLRQALTA